MSRRPQPTNAEQNRATLKSLVKLEFNKSCADCKTNKHPRWASWNLGIFVCIRCSGIHRGMGTHISRVKSVDLDSWTDEQTQKMVQWGNARANRYWEDKLAAGHVPSEPKIENFIRTKYESKRWVMDGPIPDPSELDTGDVPSQGSSINPAAKPTTQSSRPFGAAAAIDLFHDETHKPVRPSTVPPPRQATNNPPPSSNTERAKQTKPAESLLGLDFLGGASQAVPTRSSGDLGGLASTPASSKTDLKQSILSLYASVPNAKSQAQAQAQIAAAASPSFAGMNNAFGLLNLSSPSTAPAASKPAAAFAGLMADLANSEKPAPTATSSFGSGGSLFDSIPKSPPPTQVTSSMVPKTHSSLGSFNNLFPSTAPQLIKKPLQPSLSVTNNLFDLAQPSQPSKNGLQQSLPGVAIQPDKSINPISSTSTAFNLSSLPVQAQKQAPKPISSNTSPFPAMDAWGSSNVWGAPEPNTNTALSTAAHHNTTVNLSSPSTNISADLSSGWGSLASSNSLTSGSQTKPVETAITADEDFGGWNSAPTAIVPASTGDAGNSMNLGAGWNNAPSAAPIAGSMSRTKSGGLNGGSDDLFGNVWS